MILDKRPAPGTDDAERVANLGEQEVQQALARLSCRERQAVTLRHPDGLGYDEIGCRAGLSYLTVKADERKGLGRLREVLAAGRECNGKVTKRNAGVRPSYYRGGTVVPTPDTTEGP